VVRLSNLSDNITAVDVVLKAIDLTLPVTNFGGAIIFNETWQSVDPFDSNQLSGVWKKATQAGCHPTLLVAAEGTVRIAAGCGLTTRSMEARTFNFFRHPLAVTLDDILIEADALEFGFEVPSLGEMNVTSWPRFHHYLSRQDGESFEHRSLGDGPAASLTVALTAAGKIQLWRRKVRGGDATLLQSSVVPIGCATVQPAKVCLSAGSVFTSDPSVTKVAPPFKANVKLFCNGTMAVNMSADLGLSFLDAQGFGDSVGETVLVLRASSSTPPTSERGAKNDSTAVPASVQFGHINIENRLDPMIAPAVLAPVTDMAGITNWDHGSMGSWHDLVDPPYGPSDGVLDVTKPPFSADNTGVHDATEALQSAIDFSRFNYLSLWMPAGEYKVTKSLQLVQRPRMASDGFAELNLTSNYGWSRFSTWALRGEVSVADSIGYAVNASVMARPGRATLVLPPNTQAFGLIKCNATAPLAVLNFSNINARGQLEPNTLMSMVLQSVDVVIGAGNPAAVGVRMRGAQGSSIEDVAVFAADDAFAGISGVSGSGGAHSNITVVGARFGIDARDTQPSASLSNIRLINQTCAALIHEGLETLTIAGAHVVVGRSAEPEAAAFVSGSPGSTLPGLPTTGKCTPLLPPSTTVCQSSLIAGAMSMVDVGFECLGCSSATAIATSRNLYLRRAVFVGFDSIARVHSPSNITGKLRYELKSRSMKGGTRVHELSVPVPVQFPTINSTAFIDGKAIETAGAAIENISETQIGITMQSEDGLNWEAACDRHGWGDNNAFPTHAWHNALNVRAFGAHGDGVHDDTQAIQQAVDAAASVGAPVFVPRGVFRTSSSIVVPRGVRLIGLARHLSYIVSDDASFSITSAAGSAGYRPSRRAHVRGSTEGRTALYDSPPIVLFANTHVSNSSRTRPSGAAGLLGSVFFGLTLLIPAYNAKTNTCGWVFTAGVDSANGFNVARQFWVTRRPVCGEWWDDRCSARFNAQLPFERAYARIEGGDATLRAFALFQEDGIPNNGAKSQSPFSRKLLVRDTRHPVDIYQLNGEHSTSTAYAEFRNTTGVSVYGCKSERRGAVIFVRGSSNFASYGHGGAAHETKPSLGPDECDGMSPCPWKPSLYRIVDSENVRFVNLQQQFYSSTSSMMFDVHDGSNSSAPPGEWPSLWFRS
jgi:hypothetical protein